MPKDDSGQAFPGSGWGRGMSLRDYFAAKAMQSLIVKNEQDEPVSIIIKKITKWSYEMADAMIKERDK